MASEVFVHIGPPKTGTTFLQAILWRNRALLRSQGVLVPGPSSVHHFHAAVDLIGRDVTGLGEQTAGAWPNLVRALDRWEQRAVVSHENFGFAAPAHVRRARADLADTDVHIIYTARALTAVAPAAWQERLKNREDFTWAGFMEALRSADPPSPFWRQHGGTSLSAWAEGLPPERVHVVTVPPTGSSPTLLWERFAGVIGIDTTDVVTDVPRSNASLGIDEAGYLRHFNRGPGQDLDWSTYRAGVKHGLAPVLSRLPDKRRISVTGADAALLRERTDALLDTIRSASFDVVGDLDELVDATPEQTSAADNDTVDAESLRRSADAAVAGLVRELADLVHARREEVADLRRKATQERQSLTKAVADAEERLATAEGRLADAQARSEVAIWRLALHRLADRSAAVDRIRRAVRRRRR